MEKRKANQAAREALILGYKHTSRREERVIMDRMLLGDGLENFTVKYTDRHQLADKEMRSVKNNLICAVAVICRAAADFGADDKKCYALSDYYINEIERAGNDSDWTSIVTEIFTHYKELINEGCLKYNSLPVRRAIAYIRQHIYEKCSLKSISEAITLNAVYLSSKFKQETGLTLTEYIIDEKMAEAKLLLENSDYTISEISETLGFGSMSYFAKVFRKKFNCSPSEMRLRV